MPNNSSEKLAPLNITCTSTDCENGLHCFKQKQRMRKKAELNLTGDWMQGLDSSGAGVEAGLSGRCRACGEDLVDWSRVHKRELNDVAYTFEALKKELIRHHYWHIPIDQYAKNHALRKGSIAMYAYVEKIIRLSVGPEKPVRDGMQTPKSRNIVYYAQHATASCCRACIEEWHKIPRGRALEEEEILYLSDLARLYIKERLPELQSEGIKVPPIRKTRFLS